MNSFLSGKKVLAVAPLRPLVAPHASAGPAAAGTRPHGSGTHHPIASHPTVEVVKEGDKVVRLVVICTCGERVEIDCLYPGGG